MILTTFVGNGDSDGKAFVFKSDNTYISLQANVVLPIVEVNFVFVCSSKQKFCDMEIFQCFKIYFGTYKSYMKRTNNLHVCKTYYINGLFCHIT